MHIRRIGVLGSTAQHLPKKTVLKTRISELALVAIRAAKIMLQLRTIALIPADTIRVAKEALPPTNTCLALHDHLGTLFDDVLFAPLFQNRGQPVAAPWRLALVTILQFAERLSDRDAAEAVRSRIDCKYLLGLELSDPGFDYSILSRFRDRLIEGNAEMCCWSGFWINANPLACCAHAAICAPTQRTLWLRSAI